MSIKTRAAALVFAAVATSWASFASHAATLTESATLPPTTTNFNTDGSGVTPLTFQQFNTQGGTLKLDSVDLTVSATVQNGFGMTFTTPATITGTVSSSSTSTTTGPSVTVYKPDGTTALITAGSDTPASRSETYGTAAGQTTFPTTFSSSLSSTSPYYIAPVTTSASNSLVLTDPADLALFTGTGTLKLPVSASVLALHLDLGQRRVLGDDPGLGRRHGDVQLLGRPLATADASGTVDGSALGSRQCGGTRVPPRSPSRLNFSAGSRIMKTPLEPERVDVVPTPRSPVPRFLKRVRWSAHVRGQRRPPRGV